VRTSYESGTLEVPRIKKRFVFARIEARDDGVAVYDKRTGQQLHEEVAPQGDPAVAKGAWTYYGSDGVRMKEHCSPCTRGRATRTEDMI
jgi:hypothetical protein